MPTRGFKELDQQLANLAEAVGPKRANRVMKNALKQAATPVLKMARAKAPVGDRKHRTYKGTLAIPGFLRKNIDKQAFVTKQGTGVVRMGPKAEAFYGTTFLERGTKYISPMPWLVPAFEAASSAMLSKFGEALAKLIDKEVNKK
jgi:HK97 gp10 family phage protein